MVEVTDRAVNMLFCNIL